MVIGEGKTEDEGFAKIMGGVKQTIDTNESLGKTYMK
jgi:hypothetical protein